MKMMASTKITPPSGPMGFEATGSDGPRRDCAGVARDARGRQTRGQTRGVSVANPLLPAVVDRLVAAGCVDASEEAPRFLAAPDERTLEAWLRRREQGEPLAWITGTVMFCGHTLHVAPGVYVPRSQPEGLARRAPRPLPDQ